MFTHSSRTAEKQSRRSPLRALVSGTATAALVGSTLMFAPQVSASLDRCGDANADLHSFGNPVVEYCELEFTATGSWTVPTEISSIDILVIGGGGGGGGGAGGGNGYGATYSDSHVGAGGGGGGGGAQVVLSENQTVNSGESLSITIGDGGSGGSGSSVSTASTIDNSSQRGSTGTAGEPSTVSSAGLSAPLTAAGGGAGTGGGRATKATSVSASPASAGSGGDGGDGGSGSASGGGGANASGLVGTDGSGGSGGAAVSIAAVATAGAPFSDMARNVVAGGGGGGGAAARNAGLASGSGGAAAGVSSGGSGGTSRGSAGFKGDTAGGGGGGGAGNTNISGEPNTGGTGGIGASGLVVVRYLALPIPSPTISAVTPSTGIASGDSISVSGAALSDATLTLSGEPVALTTNSATAIVFEAPSLESGSHRLVVTTAGGSASATIVYAPEPSPPSPGGGGGAAAPVAPAVVTPGPSAPASLSERPDPGAANALVGGQEVEVTFSPLVNDSSTSAAADRISSLPESLRTIAPQPNGVQVSAGGVGVSVTGPQASWARTPGLLILAPDAPLAVKTTGFGAGSPVRVYVQNAGGTWVLVDTLSTGPDGTLDAAVTIPANAPVGPGVLQFEGTNGSGEQITLAIGAQIAPPVAPVPTADGPLPQVNPGQAVATDADGNPVEFSVNRVNGTDVEIRVGESLTSIQAVDAEGTQPLAADGAIEIEEEGFVRVGGEGFQPNSMVQVWAFSEATFVGLVLTDENGTYTSLLELPEELELGDHTLQNSGTAFDGQPLAVSAGLRIIAPGSDGTEEPQAVETARANTTVYFGRGSSALDAVDRKKLDRLVRKVGDSAQRVRITGYVQASSTTSNDQSLSRARARSVAKYLRSQGVDAKYTIRGRGVLDAPSDEARSARVTVVYTK